MFQMICNGTSPYYSCSDNLNTNCSYEDISEYVLREAEASESEGEEVDLPPRPDKTKSDQPAQQMSSVRLVEVRVLVVRKEHT